MKREATKPDESGKPNVHACGGGKGQLLRGSRSTPYRSRKSKGGKRGGRLTSKRVRANEKRIGMIRCANERCMGLGIKKERVQEKKGIRRGFPHSNGIEVKELASRKGETQVQECKRVEG